MQTLLSKTESRISLTVSLLRGVRFPVFIVHARSNRHDRSGK